MPSHDRMSSEAPERLFDPCVARVGFFQVLTHLRSKLHMTCRNPDNGLAMHGVARVGQRPRLASASNEVPNHMKQMPVESIAARTRFQPIKTPRVFEGVCEQIKLKLVNGELRPGDRLPAERDLAVEFGVGRPAIREALRTLEITGIVETKKGVKGGAFVREGSPEMLTQSLQHLVMLGHITQFSLAEARMQIHGIVIRLACERGETEDFDRIEENLNRIQHLADVGDHVGRAEEAVRFFRLIAEAGRNDVLVALVDALGAILRHFAVERQPVKFRPELVPMRWNMLKYMRARSANKAMAEMNKYLSIVHADVLQSVAAKKRKDR